MDKLRGRASGAQALEAAGLLAVSAVLLGLSFAGILVALLPGPGVRVRAAVCEGSLQAAWLDGVHVGQCEPVWPEAQPECQDSGGGEKSEPLSGRSVSPERQDSQLEAFENAHFNFNDCVLTFSRGKN